MSQMPMGSMGGMGGMPPMPPQAQMPPAIGSMQPGPGGSDIPTCPCCGQPMVAPFNGQAPNMPSPAAGAMAQDPGQAQALMALLGAGGGGGTPPGGGMGP